MPAEQEGRPDGGVAGRVQYEGTVLSGEQGVEARKQEEAIKAARVEAGAGAVPGGMARGRKGVGTDRCVADYDPVLRGHCRLD